jgi:2-octaprenyl-6-methoxyphenol hydroxylase
MKTDYDLLIIGGGMVGASLACALRNLPLRIGLVEASAPGAVHPSFDARAIALAQGSKRIYDGLGLWGAMEAAGVTPIRHIHVSDRGRFGSARLSAEREGVDALGYVVEANVIGRVLEEALGRVGNAELLRPAQVAGVEIQGDRASVRLQTGSGERTVGARLLVAADGGRSAVREILGERSVHLGYGQTAVIAYVVTDRPHGHVAYERFTETGPLAMLPCHAARGSAEEADGDRRWSLVWTARDEEVDQLLALTDGEFLARLQERLGFRAGRVLATSPRHAYPLSLHYVRDHVRDRVVFIGNAAHTIHPVGGQGYNLGLRDVAALGEVLADAAKQGEDPGAPSLLDAYARWRKPDHMKVLSMTDGLARLFSNALEPLALVRTAGLIGMDLLPPLKHLFARQAMGFADRQPRLARGLPLIG